MKMIIKVNGEEFETEPNSEYNVEQALDAIKRLVVDASYFIANLKDGSRLIISGELLRNSILIVKE